MTRPAVVCCNCDGKGIVRAFMRIDNGRCFACGGSGRVALGEGTAGRAPAPLTRERAIKACAERLRFAEYAGSLFAYLAEELEVYGARIPRFVAYLRERGHADVADRFEAAVCREFGATMAEIADASERSDSEGDEREKAWLERRAAYLAQCAKHKKRRSSVTPA